MHARSSVSEALKSEPVAALECNSDAVHTPAPQHSATFVSTVPPCLPQNRHDSWNPTSSAKSRFMALIDAEFEVESQSRNARSTKVASRHIYDFCIFLSCFVAFSGIALLRVDEPWVNSFSGPSFLMELSHPSNLCNERYRSSLFRCFHTSGAAIPASAFNVTIGGFTMGPPTTVSAGVALRAKACKTSSAVHEANYCSPFISCSPCALLPPMDEKSRAPDGAGATLHSFLQIILRYTFARTTVLLIAFASVSFGDICCVVRELDCQFSVAWLHRKWLRIRRVTASAVMALCIVFVPLCAKGQVYQPAHLLLIHGQCFHFSDEHARVSILCCMLLDVIMLKRYLSL